MINKNQINIAQWPAVMAWVDQANEGHSGSLKNYTVSIANIDLRYTIDTSTSWWACVWFFSLFPLVKRSMHIYDNDWHHFPFDDVNYLGLILSAGNISIDWHISNIILIKSTRISVLRGQRNMLWFHFPLPVFCLPHYETNEQISALVIDRHILIVHWTIICWICWYFP